MNPKLEIKTADALLANPAQAPQNSSEVTEVLQENTNRFFILQDTIEELEKHIIDLNHVIQKQETQFPVMHKHSTTDPSANRDALSQETKNALYKLHKNRLNKINNQGTKKEAQSRAVNYINTLMNTASGIKARTITAAFLEHKRIAKLLTTTESQYTQLRHLFTQTEFYRHQMVRYRKTLLQCAQYGESKAEDSPIDELLNTEEKDYFTQSGMLHDEDIQYNTFNQLLKWWDTFHPIINIIAPHNTFAQYVAKCFQTLMALEDKFSSLPKVLYSAAPNHKVDACFIEFEKAHAAVCELWPTESQKLRSSVQIIQSIKTAIVQAHFLHSLEKNNLNRLATTLYNYLHTFSYQNLNKTLHTWFSLTDEVNEQRFYQQKIKSLLEKCVTEPLNTEQEAFIKYTQRWYDVITNETTYIAQTTLQDYIVKLKQHIANILEPRQTLLIDKLNESRRETALNIMDNNNVFFKQEKFQKQAPQSKPKLRLTIPGAEYITQREVKEITNGPTRTRT